MTETIAGILFDYGIAENTAPDKLSDDTDENMKIRELMYADVLDICANMPSTRNNSSGNRWSMEVRTEVGSGQHTTAGYFVQRQNLSVKIAVSPHRLVEVSNFSQSVSEKTLINKML